MKQDKNHIDLATFVAVMTLLVMSLGVVYSASSTWMLEKWGESGRLLGSHALKVLVGFAALFLFMQIDYHKYRRLTKPLLLVSLLLLAVTLAVGGEVKGATRWLRIWAFGIQPSELAKYALIFHLSVLLAVKKEQIKDFTTGFLPMMFWIGAVTVLVLVQPNFSTGAMIFAISMLLLYLGRAKVSHLALTFAALVPLLLLFMVSKPYRMQRILSYLEDGSAQTNHQLTQGIIGFGNGGLIGLGPGGSRQRDLFLPESYGDFVFSIVGEEYGLVGTLFIVLLFLTIMVRGMKIARHATDDLGRGLALGITCSITLYALVNAGVTIGLLPTTGLPMPFVSYGGTSIVLSCSAIGALLNISMQTDLHPRVRGAPEGVRPLDPVQLPEVGKVY
ncbi:MAG: FtsW/RodA/SpoVE family cell cycle protein [Bacteroidota bacterium]